MHESYIYEKCYYHLFNAVTAQIKALEALTDPPVNIIKALKTAQCETEELFISAKDSQPPCSE